MYDARSQTQWRRIFYLIFLLYTLLVELFSGRGSSPLNSKWKEEARNGHERKTAGSSWDAGQYILFTDLQIDRWIFNYDIELRSYKCFCKTKTPSDFVVSAKVMPLSSKFYCSCSFTLWASANVLLRYIPSTLNIYFLIYQAFRSVQRFIIRDFNFFQRW